MSEKHLSIELLQVQKLITSNELQAITNPIFFNKNSLPTSDGLLSNEVFGISKVDRGGTFAYIDLEEEFIHPLIYKIWGRMDSRIKDIVHGTKKFKIDEKGELIEDENGKTGIKFLKANIDNIKIRETESDKRSTNIKLVQDSKKIMFMSKCVVIPAYYRDVDTSSGQVAVGDVNKLYNSLIIAVRSLKETADYGLSISEATKGRIQETLVAIYDWFVAEPQLSKKQGITRRAVLSKTTDFANRLVISAPNLDVDSYEDMMVDLDHSAVPLASVCSSLYPYMIFHMRRLFDNEFASGKYPYMNKDGKVEYLTVKDPQIEFSDTRLKKELDRFIRGFSNRLIPILVPNVEGKNVYMQFKGRNVAPEDVGGVDVTPLAGRRLTWCDILYQAAVEASSDKCVLITRYPLEDYFGQFPTKIVVSSTKQTEPMYLDGKFYKYYPHIREDNIGKNTSNRFIDTLVISNVYLQAIGGDYKQ